MGECSDHFTQWNIDTFGHIQTAREAKEMELRRLIENGSQSDHLAFIGIQKEINRLLDREETM